MWSAALAVDLRLAIRRLRRSPVFLLGSVTTLAVALGVTSATVRVWRAVEPSTADVPGGDRISAVGPIDDGVVRLDGVLDVERVAELRARLSDVAVVSGVRQLRTSLVSDNASRVRFIEVIDASYFELFDTPARIGRLLGRADAGASTIVLSDRLARGLFPGAESPIGATVTLAQQRYIVVGVAAPEFRGLTAPSFLGADAWTVDAPATTGVSRAARLARVFIRPRTPAGVPEIESALAAAGLGSRGLREALMPSGLLLATRAAGASVAAVTLCMLLVALTSLAALLVSRILSLRTTVETQVALGAPPSGAFRSFLIEGLLITTLAVGAAVPVGRWLMVQMAAVVGDDAMGVRPFLHVDQGIDLVTPLTGLVTALVLVAAVRTWCAGWAPITGAAAGPAGQGLRRTSGLIGLQVAISMMLLSGAAVAARGSATTAATHGWPWAVSPQLTRVDLRLTGLDARGRRELTRQLADLDLREAGIAASAVSTGIPVGRDGSFVRVPTRGGVRLLQVDRNFFHVYAIPVRGRDLSQSSDERAVVVSRSVVDWLWPDGNAIGRILDIESAGQVAGYTVVGVADTVALPGATPEQSRQVYIPLESQAPDRLVLSMTAGSGGVAGQRLRALLVERFAGVPFAEVVSLDAELQQESWALLAAARLTLVGAVFTAAITLIALYSVARVELQSRLRDVGIMIAIGADATHLWLLVGGPFQRALARGTAAGALLCGAMVLALGDLVPLAVPHVVATLGATAISFALVLGMAIAVPVIRLRRWSPVVLLRN